MANKLTLEEYRVRLDAHQADIAGLRRELDDLRGTCHDRMCNTASKGAWLQGQIDITNKTVSKLNTELGLSLPRIGALEAEVKKLKRRALPTYFRNLWAALRNKR